MRTLLFIVGGFFVYFLLLLTTDRADRAAVARISVIFIVGWFVVAVGNMFYGVTQAGYSVGRGTADRLADLRAAGDPRRCCSGCENRRA